MTVPEPARTPDLERPIDLTDRPVMARPGPPPEHHPADGEQPDRAHEPGIPPRV